METAIKSQNTYFADILFILSSFIHVDVVEVEGVCAATKKSQRIFLLQFYLVYRAMCRGNRRFTHLADYTFEYHCSQFNAIQMMKQLGSQNCSHRKNRDDCYDAFTQCSYTSAYAARRLPSPAIAIQKSTERDVEWAKITIYFMCRRRNAKKWDRKSSKSHRTVKKARCAHEKSVNLRVEIIFNYSHFSRILYEVFVGNDVVVIGTVIVVSKLTRAHDCSKNTFSTYIEMTEPRARSGSRIQTILAKVYFIWFFPTLFGFFW